MKMTMFFLFVFCMMLKGGVAVIYSLNETDYHKMPALYSLDDYSSCLLNQGDTYCVADFGMYGGDPELFSMIKQYSDYSMKHFNHTQLHRGICINKSCKEYIINTDMNNTVDLRKSLEACVNASIWRDYKLKVRLEKVLYCNKTGDSIPIDIYDILIAIIYITIIMLNLIGSFYDFRLRKNGDKKGNPYLLAFSLQQNWEKLVATNSRGVEPRLDRLKLFYGLRTMTMICVFFSHTVLIMAFAYVENPLFIEKAYEDPLKQILFNGSLVTHTFFLMSSFLLAYNLEIHAEKNTVDWRQFPKGMMMRWLRLSPVYALGLATVCTWMRHLGSGPLWGLVVGSEATACRQYWWAHLLYINNYIYGDAWCYPQTWYLAADTQLFCFGLLLCILFRTKRSRIIALLSSFILSLTIVAFHTYLQDLDAVVIQSPETYRELYANDDTFRLMYIRGHTNLSASVLGLAGGFLTYYWQNGRKDFSAYKQHRWLLWLMLPIGIAIILSGGLFYTDGPKASVGARIIYATLYKPLFQAVVVCFIIGCIFKIESVYRSVVEWRGFTWTGRISYSAFLIHTMFQRGLVGGQLRPSYMSDYYVVIVLAATIFLSFICASGVWLLVEAPAAALTRAALSPRKRNQESDNEDA